MFRLQQSGWIPVSRRARVRVTGADVAGVDALVVVVLDQFDTHLKLNSWGLRSPDSFDTLADRIGLEHAPCVHDLRHARRCRCRTCTAARQPVRYALIGMLRRTAVIPCARSSQVRTRSGDFRAMRCIQVRASDPNQPRRGSRPCNRVGSSDHLAAMAMTVDSSG